MSQKSPKSPSEKTQDLVYFARMCDKIRLHTKGELPPDYHANLGKGFDQRCVDFLQVKYDDVVRVVKEGKSDDQVLEWCFSRGFKPTAEQTEVWNEFLRKRGWNDEATEVLKKRMKEGGFENRDDIQTIFDYIDLDEDRDPAKR